MNIGEINKHSIMKQLGNYKEMTTNISIEPCRGCGKQIDANKPSKRDTIPKVYAVCEECSIKIEKNEIKLQNESEDWFMIRKRQEDKCDRCNRDRRPEQLRSVYYENIYEDVTYLCEACIELSEYSTKENPNSCGLRRNNIFAIFADETCGGGHMLDYHIVHEPVMHNLEEHFKLSPDDYSDVAGKRFCKCWTILMEFRREIGKALIDQDYNITNSERFKQIYFKHTGKELVGSSRIVKMSYTKIGTLPYDRKVSEMTAMTTELKEHLLRLERNDHKYIMGLEKEQLIRLDNINHQYKLFEHYLSKKRDNAVDKIDAEEEYKIQIEVLKQELNEDFPKYDIEKVISAADRIRDRINELDKELAKPDEPLY